MRRLIAYCFVCVILVTSCQIAEHGPPGQPIEEREVTTQPFFSAQRGDCGSLWSIGYYSGEILSLLPYYPDTNATYWAIGFDRENPNLSLRLSGKFAFARYQSITLYDRSAGEIVKSLKDINLEPNQGSINPYRVGADRQEQDRDYTVDIVPQGFENNQPNEIVMNHKLNQLMILLRVYLPDNANDRRGGVSLPEVSVYDAASGQPADCPKSKIFDSLPTGSETAVLPSSSPEKPILFWRSALAGNFPNRDNTYVLTDLRHRGDAVVVRIRPPKILATRNNPAQPFDGTEEVRYWSVCLGGAITTLTSNCLADEELTIQADGFAYLVISRNLGGFANFARENGFNFLPWSFHIAPVLIFRHMSPNPTFTGAFSNAHLVSEIPGSEEELNTLSADKVLGDYSPIGQRCSRRQFRDDFCGVYNQ